MRYIQTSLRSVLSALLCIAITLIAAEARTEPIKRALLIGINEYESPDLTDLGGAVNDVELMRSVLVGKFVVPEANIRVLTDAQATRKAILAAIREHLIEADPPADVAIIHFSGHGSQMTDGSGDELDGFDETIVPHDARMGDVRDISDDEINGLLTQLAAVTPNITLIMDSCHSGSVARAAEAGVIVRQAPRDRREALEPENFAIGERGTLEGPSGFRLSGAHYVLVSGSQANELSHEGLIGDTRHGALSFYLSEALRGTGDATTYRDIMAGVGTKVSARFPAQHPDLEGTSLDTVVFGDRQVLPRPFVLVEPASGDRVSIKAGKVYGIESGTVLDAYPPGTKQFDGSIASTARVKVTSVRDFEADGVIEGEGRVAAHSRAALETIRPPDYYTGVYFHDLEDSVMLQSIRDRLADHESVRVVASRGDAEIRVRQVNGSIRLEGSDLQTLSEVREGQSNLTERVVEQIIHWGRWYAILAIDNPNPSVNVDLRIHRSGTPASAPLAQVTLGSQVDITVTNRSNTNLYLTILDLSSDGSICVLYPGNECQAVEHSDFLPSGGVLPLKNINTVEPQNRDMSVDVVSVDVVKVIATTTKISPRVFQLGPVPRSAASTRAGESGLERYLRLYSQGLTRNLSPSRVEGWVTRSNTFRVVRPAASEPVYAVHFTSEDAAQGASASLSRSRSVCGPTAPVNCYEVKPLPGDPTIVEVRSPGARGRELVTSVGNAFEEAYRLSLELGAVRAEPLFEMELNRTGYAPHPDSPEARGISQPEHDPRAEADPLWSLKHTRVPQAWAAIRAAMNKPAGAEAKEVVIAHPDTGYREHAEIWNLDPSISPVWPAKGYDYFGEDHDPTDDLIADQPLDNPAHGTGSGSAIISPAGCQLPGATKCPTGPALGARLVPLRVNRSVTHFDMERMTKAILDASGDDRSRVKVKTDVMSISMGGVPSWALWKAVKQAEKRGYLIVAAAGNYVKVVVWPARFRSVIGVAATNVGCEPWAWTSVGPAVDFSAPGESVWRGTLDENGEKIVGMGTGTTYATATTAGIAALWVARHKGTPEFEALKAQGKLTETFRSLVQQTAWRPNATPPRGVTCDPDTGWSSFFMGAGIIDAAALLEQPLTAARAKGVKSAETLQELPLWSSLYDEPTPADVAIADYRQLFRLANDADLESVAIFEAEVMFHYTMNEKVAAALDAFPLRGDRSDAAFAAAREALRAQDLSARLREAL